MVCRSRRHSVVVCTGCPRHTASALAAFLMDADGHSQPPKPLPNSCGYSFTLMLNWSQPHPLASLCPLDSVPSMSQSKHHQPWGLRAWGGSLPCFIPLFSSPSTSTRLCSRLTADISDHSFQGNVPSKGLDCPSRFSHKQHYLRK